MTNTLDKLDYLMIIELLKIPKWCRGEGDNFESHEWVNAWSEPMVEGSEAWQSAHSKLKDRLVAPVTLLPYQVCKHCHKRSNAKD